MQKCTYALYFSDDDLDLLEEAVQDFEDTWRRIKPEDAELTQNEYDKRMLRIRAIKNEIRVAYLTQHFVYNPEQK